LASDNISDNHGDDVAGIIADLRGLLDPLFDAMTWAEDEIDAASRRHPAAVEKIQRSFLLLRPAHPGMRSQALCRSHCRELLDRVARGEDSRPGTAAEGCIAMSAISLMAPLRASAVGLYLRLWRLAGLPPIDATSDEHYEALHASAIDDGEAVLRGALR
jgi:hypothetical protein